VSAISFWEIALLIAKTTIAGASGRGRAAPPKILAAGIHELPLTGDIALLGFELEKICTRPGRPFHRRDRDRHGATLMTAE